MTKATVWLSGLQSQLMASQTSTDLSFKIPKPEIARAKPSTLERTLPSTMQLLVTLSKKSTTTTMSTNLRLFQFLKPETQLARHPLRRTTACSKSSQTPMARFQKRTAVTQFLATAKLLDLPLPTCSPLRVSIRQPRTWAGPPSSEKQSHLDNLTLPWISWPNWAFLLLQPRTHSWLSCKNLTRSRRWALAARTTTTHTSR